ncbi:hypothetical protein UPYG_G00227230 [Umbra pygmaea]|uniref:Uncharacterized protein n=1 Tax=Umbra pygmaea TaxID=75934 RepID=A0ABD0WI00_UMBPY
MPYRTMSLARRPRRVTPTLLPPTPLHPPIQVGLVQPPELPHSPLLLQDTPEPHSLVQVPQGMGQGTRDTSPLVLEHLDNILELPLPLVGSLLVQGCQGNTQPDMVPQGSTLGSTILVEVQDSTQPDLAPQGNTQPDLAPQGNTQPDLAPQGNTQPDLAPQGNTQPDLAPQGNIQPDLAPQGNTQPDLAPQGNTQPDLAPQGNTQPDLAPQGSIQQDLAPQDSTQPDLVHLASFLELLCSTHLAHSRLVLEHLQERTPTRLTQEPSPGVGCMDLAVRELPSLGSLVERSLPSPLDHGVLQVVEASPISQANRAPSVRDPWDHMGDRWLQAVRCPDITHHTHHTFESNEHFSLG